MDLQTFVFLVLFLFFFVSFFYFASFLYKSCKLQFFFGGEGRLMVTLKINRLCNYFVFLSR